MTEAERISAIGHGMLRNREVLLKIIQFLRTTEHQQTSIFNWRRRFWRVDQLNALADELLCLDEISKYKEQKL